MRQAQTIAALSIQRDHLIREAEAERARRESEKEGWDREAEALIVQQRQRYSDGARFEVFEHSIYSPQIFNELICCIGSRAACI